MASAKAEVERWSIPVFRAKPRRVAPDLGVDEVADRGSEELLLVGESEVHQSLPFAGRNTGRLRPSGSGRQSTVTGWSHRTSSGSDPTRDVNMMGPSASRTRATIPIRRPRSTETSWILGGRSGQPVALLFLCLSGSIWKCKSFCARISVFI